jgi:hypothetical protein
MKVAESSSLPRAWANKVMGRGGYEGRGSEDTHLAR